MRYLIIIILLISSSLVACSQEFLEAYKQYRLENAGALSDRSTKKKIKSFIKSHILELDTVIKSYKLKTNFDFNTADTVFLIYISPNESPFTSDIIIWSGNDTISYQQRFEAIKPFKYKRIITYKPFVIRHDKFKGFNVVNERDSLITLVANRDFKVINHLGDKQNISDGSYVSIYVVYKAENMYMFETCFPKQFIIRDVYTKE